MYFQVKHDIEGEASQNKSIPGDQTGDNRKTKEREKKYCTSKMMPQLPKFIS